jgi:alkanesulfonate monooxygenase SsuD/methylene tetrahydromethanopterin reductase-like flavin-dependent oxidoreductase (luciferase family)
VPRLSIALPVHGTSFAHTLSVARAAEEAGFEGLWVPDHLLNLSRPTAGVLECWMVLAAVAAVTTRVRIGPLVVATPLRHPPLLAKQAATLCDLAPGRVVLGLGAGGFTYEEACRQLGIGALSAGDRVVHVRETIQCIRAMLSQESADFTGRFLAVTGARIFPRPEQMPPIILAAERSQMLQVTARLADGWNCPRPADLEVGLAALELAGRARASIDVSTYVVTVIAETDAAAAAALVRAGRGAHAFGDVEQHHIVGSPTRVIERIAEFARRGVNELVLDLRGTPHLEAIELLAETIWSAAR